MLKFASSRCLVASFSENIALFFRRNRSKSEGRRAGCDKQSRSNRGKTLDTICDEKYEERSVEYGPSLQRVAVGLSSCRPLSSVFCGSLFASRTLSPPLQPLDLGAAPAHFSLLWGLTPSPYQGPDPAHAHGPVHARPVSFAPPWLERDSLPYLLRDRPCPLHPCLY